FTAPPPPRTYTLSLHDALPIWRKEVGARMPTPNPDYVPNPPAKDGTITLHARTATIHGAQLRFEPLPHKNTLGFWTRQDDWAELDRKSTRLNSSHVAISYAVFC